MNDTDPIQINLKQLTRGLLQSSYPTMYEAYKVLYGIGQPVISIVKEKILETDWSKSKGS